MNSNWPTDEQSFDVQIGANASRPTCFHPNASFLKLVDNNWGDLAILERRTAIVPKEEILRYHSDIDRDMFCTSMCGRTDASLDELQAAMILLMAGGYHCHLLQCIKACMTDYNKPEE